MIDSTNNTLIRNVTVSSFPQQLLYNPSNNNIYVANVVSNSVTILNSTNNTVADTINVNSLPLALEYNPSNNGVYVAGTVTGIEGVV